MACSTVETKILPSPILSVLAAAMMAAIGGIDLIVGQDDLDLHLGQEVDDVFGAAIKLGMALLAAKALDLDHGQALDADVLKRFFHLVELERLDDRLDLFHRFNFRGCSSLGVRPLPAGSHNSVGFTRADGVPGIPEGCVKKCANRLKNGQNVIGWAMGGLLDRAEMRKIEADAIARGAATGLGLMERRGAGWRRP